MARRPPLGKEDASGSPRTSSLPEKSIITRPPPALLIKLSCFSAVTPLKGWNQCVKCVAPCSSAQVFIASAISFAAERGRGCPLFKQPRQTSMALCGTYCSIVRSLNTSEPKSSGMRVASLMIQTSCFKIKNSISNDTSSGQAASILCFSNFIRALAGWNVRGERNYESSPTFSCTGKMAVL